MMFFFSLIFSLVWINSHLCFYLFQSVSWHFGQTPPLLVDTMLTKFSNPPIGRQLICEWRLKIIELSTFSVSKWRVTECPRKYLFFSCHSDLAKDGTKAVLRTKCSSQGFKNKSLTFDETVGRLSTSNGENQYEVFVRKTNKTKQFKTN